MDRRNGHHRKSIVLYDLGGWYVIIIFGVAFSGLVLDYLWNYFVLSLTLRWQHISITRKRKMVYIAIITALGLLIDWLWLYVVFSRPGTQPGLALATIIIPMVLIGLVNLCASRIHLHLSMKNALVVAGMMAVFTAPWLIVVFVFLS